MANYNRMFTDDEADKVWVDQFGEESSSKDVTGATVHRNQHSQNGWHVDHIKPLSKGRSENDLENLQVLKAEENFIKADNYPNWKDTKGEWHYQLGK